MNRRLVVFLLTVVAMVSGVNVVSQAQSFLTRHVREVTLNGQAQSIGRLPAIQNMRIDIVLPLRHQPELDNFLEALYDPTSPSYRHFVTVPEFTARFGPSQEDYDAVIRFAETNGFKVVGGSRDGMDVQLKGTVANIEKAFHVIMGVYQHPTESRTFYAPDREPTVSLAFPLWHVSGLDNYSIPRPALVHRSEGVKANVISGSCPGNSYCGSDMRAAYYGGTALTGAGQTVGLLEFLGFEISDLNTYFSTVGQTDNVPVIGVSTDGSPLGCLASQGCDDTEQIIDMTQAISMAPGMKALYVFVGASDTAMLSSMSTHLPLDAQLSSSWTWSPADPSTDDPYFKKFSAQGQNYFQAAGDSGAFKSNFQDVFPADDAYVTTVGGTDLITNGAGGAWSSETAWVDGGGAFFTPDAIPIPSWQQTPGVITAANEGSTTLRNAPDVSAEANFDFFFCSNQGPCSDGLGGTSFAAPMWAGFMALVNQQIIANGFPTLGFINPTVYQIGLGAGYGAAFHDITAGSNGFPTTTGYDLATGWGSPNGIGFITALAGSAAPNFSLSASPNNVAIMQGASGASIITISVGGGFNGNVTLSASGLPSGVTASFSPNPATSTSTLTLTATATAATGLSTVKIAGKSGSLTGSTSVSLTVNSPTQSFSLAASPSTVTLVQGGAGSTSNISITPHSGFAGNVTLAVSGLPTGVTASFSQDPTTSSSVLTLTASATAKKGTATVTVTGTSASLTASTSIALTVNAFGNFSLSAAPKTLTVLLGSSGTSTITIKAIGGFDQNVTLSAGALPAGVTATFSPNPATSTSTLTLAVSSTSNLETETITITGTAGTLSHTATVKLVTVEPDFTLTASPTAISVAQGSSGTSTLTINPLNTFNSSVALSVVSVPPGVTATFSPNPATSTSTLKLAVSSAAALKSTTIMVVGKSGFLTHTAKVKLTVTAP